MIEKMEYYSSLKEIEDGIKEREERIKAKKKEIKELEEIKYNYIEEHCVHNKGDICAQSNTPRNRYGWYCSDCIVHTHHWKVNK